MQESISLQPYVKKVSVRIDRLMLLENFFGYGELEGRMIIAQVQIDYEGEVVNARLEYDAEKKYPLMSLI
jgi:dihydroneopterin aldolase